MNQLVDLLLVVVVYSAIGALVISLLVLAAAIVIGIRDVLDAHRRERRLRQLAAQARADVRARRDQRPAAVATDGLFDQPWPVLAREPAHVFPRRRRAA